MHGQHSSAREVHGQGVGPGRSGQVNKQFYFLALALRGIFVQGEFLARLAQVGVKQGHRLGRIGKVSQHVGIGLGKDKGRAAQTQGQAQDDFGA